MDINTNDLAQWPAVLDVWNSRGDQIKERLRADGVVFQGLEVYPPRQDIFAAFRHFDISALKVVIVGQDPYINVGEAHGLAFSVAGFAGAEPKMPPSLRNIFKELERAYGVKRDNLDLTDWAQQGVLLLNTALTVREGCSGCHAKIWTGFTMDVMRRLGGLEGVVFMLWGNHAQSFRGCIDETRNLVLTWTHPSPLSRKPFTGCGHFEAANEYLKEKGKEIVVWCHFRVHSEVQ